MKRRDLGCDATGREGRQVPVSGARPRWLVSYDCCGRLEGSTAEVKTIHAEALKVAVVPCLAAGRSA